jgi:pimeloyl-ACP methyl ester carboxylesterase
MRSVRLAFRVLQRVAPERAAAVAERLFFTPPRTRLSSELTAVLERGMPFTATAAGRRISAWSWGDGPTIWLMHGWGSRGGRLAAFVAPLVAAGFRVVTHDAPGHGASDPGTSSMPEFARALRALVGRVEPPHGVIAHSMGASATALAMAQGLPVSRAVFLAPAANPAAYVDPFAAALGLTAATRRRLQERSEQRLAFRWADLDVPTLARRLAAPLLVIHDREDRVVPWADGAAITAAWSGAELVTTTGLGHREVVRAPAVMARTLAFITGGVSGAADPGTPLGEGETLERELFDREGRCRRAAIVR